MNEVLIQRLEEALREERSNLNEARYQSDAVGDAHRRGVITGLAMALEYAQVVSS